MNACRPPLRHLALALALSTLAAGVAAAPARAAVDESSREAKALFIEGMKQYNVGRYPEAITAFENGYLKKPDPTFLFNLGQCYRMLHNPEAAARQYRAYLRAQPDAPNRATVETLITEAEEEARRKAIPTPPTGTLAPSEGPPKVAVTPPEPVAAPAAAESTPVYKKWWLWTLVGVVAVGAGVGLGVGLSQSQTNTFPTVTF